MAHTWKFGRLECGFLFEEFEDEDLGAHRSCELWVAWRGKRHRRYFSVGWGQ